MILRLIPLLFPMILASGCSSFSSAKEEPPSELVTLENPLPITVGWENQIGSGSEQHRLKLAPAYYEGIVYAADRSGLVKAVEAESGKSIWEVNTEASLSGGPGADSELVVIGSRDAEVIALSAASGEELWRAAVSSEVLSVPAVSTSIVAVHANDGKVFAFDAVTGEQVWEYERSQPVLTLRGTGTPVITDNAVLVGFAGGKLVSLGLHDGNPLWESSVTVPRGRSELERMADIDADLLLKDGIVFVATFQGDLAAVAEDSGVVLWRRGLSSHAGLDADWRSLYVSDAEDNVWAIDPRSGASLWKQTKLQRRQLTAPVVVDDYLVVGDFEGYLHWLKTEDGSLAGRTRVGRSAIVYAPKNVNGILYVYGSGGALAAVRSPGPAQ